jgi:hypothetical protein
VTGVLACPALDSNPVSAFYHVIDEYVKLRVQRDFIPCKLHGLLCTQAQRVLLIVYVNSVRCNMGLNMMFVFPQNTNTMQKLRCGKRTTATPTGVSAAEPPSEPDVAPCPDPSPGADQYPNPPGPDSPAPVCGSAECGVPDPQ